MIPPHHRQPHAPRTSRYTRRLRRGLSVAAAFLYFCLGAYIPSASAADGDPCTPGKTTYISETPPAFSQLGIRDAWKLSRGNVLVAVVDSGVDASNAHLSAAVVPGIDLVDSGDGRVDDSGHGTVVAAQIAARPVEGSGLIGIAPDSRILPIRVYSDTSDEAYRAGRGPNIEKTASGIRLAAERGAVIIVVPQSSPSDAPVLRAAVDYATQAGSLVVASAGNVTEDEDANLVRFPAGYPKALSVTAVDAAGMPSTAVSQGVHVEIAAPGAEVHSAFQAWGDCVFAHDSPSTSYAAAYAAGVAALIAAAHPDETPADWEYRMLATALRPSFDHRDPAIGWGVIAPHDALNFINDGSMPGPDNPRFTRSASQEVIPRAEPYTTPPTSTVSPGIIAAFAGASGAVTLTALMILRLRKGAR